MGSNNPYRTQEAYLLRAPKGLTQSQLSTWENSTNRDITLGGVPALLSIGATAAAQKYGILNIIKNSNIGSWYNILAKNILTNIPWFIDDKSDLYYPANSAGIGLSFAGGPGAGVGFLVGSSLEAVNQPLKQLALDRGPVMEDQYPFTATYEELNRLKSRQVLLNTQIPFYTPPMALEGVGLPFLEQANAEHIKYVNEKIELLEEYLDYKLAPMDYGPYWESIDINTGSDGSFGFGFSLENYPSTFENYGGALPTGIDWSYSSGYETSLISQKQAAYRMAISAMLEREALGPKSTANLIQVASLSPFIPKSANSLYDEVSYLDFGDFVWPDEPSVSTGPILDTSLSSYLYPNASDTPDWVYKIGTSSLKILGDGSRQAKQPDPIGTAINTAYDIMSFGNTLTDVISGRRDDPGAYLSLANQAAQGLNWAAKSDAVQDVVGSLAGYDKALNNVSNVTGGALAGWGLYQNIEGLASGDFNVKDLLGVAANTSQLYNAANGLLTTNGFEALPDGLTGTMGKIGGVASGALSVIGLYEGVKGLVEGDPQNSMSILGLANNAYNVYALGSSLVTGAESGFGAAAAASLFGEAGLATAGATTMLGIAAAPLAIISVGQILSSLTRDPMTPQDARDRIDSNYEYMKMRGPENALDRVEREGPPYLDPTTAEYINEMENFADFSGYGKKHVQGMIMDALGYLGPGAITAANRMEMMDTLFSEDIMGSLANPDNWWDRHNAIEGAFQIGDFLGASREEMAPLDKAWTWENDQDQLEFMVEKLKLLASQVVEVDAGVASLQSNFQFLGENLGLSAETIPVFNEQLTVLASQFVQGQIGVDGFANGVQSIASGLGLSNEQGAALVQTVLAMVAPLIQGGSAAGALGSGVGDAASALDRALGAGQGLIGAMGGLGGAMTEGGNTAGAAGAAIDSGLTPAMIAALTQAQALASEAQAITGAIEGIPTSWESNLYFTRYYQTVGTPFHSGGLVFHAGGLVLHHGGLAGPRRFHDGGWFDELLAPFEVPAILQRGEYVVRQSSVNAQTLPWLRQVNQTGDLPDSGQGSAININAPLVQVQGGLTSDPDAIENLALLVQAKLREIQAGRFGSQAAYL